MVETTQKQRISLVNRVRQMAGPADAEAVPQHEEPPVILPDGYRRRSPVQHCARYSRRISRPAVALLVLLSAAVLVATAVYIIHF